jgi:ketosteroid isomerase-like protein
VRIETSARGAAGARRAAAAALLTTAAWLAAACRTEPHPDQEATAAADSAADVEGTSGGRPVAAADSSLAPVRLATCAAATTAATGDERARVAREVCEMFTRGAASWTRGDLDGFMSDYLPGAGTSYVGRSGVLHGPAAIRAHYAPRFAPGGTRDSLSFEQIEVDVLAPGVAHAIAYYVLSRGDSTVARGPTSLVLRKVGGRWLIVHDHSS